MKKLQQMSSWLAMNALCGSFTISMLHNSQWTISCSAIKWLSYKCIIPITIKKYGYYKWWMVVYCRIKRGWHVSLLLLKVCVLYRSQNGSQYYCVYINYYLAMLCNLNYITQIIVITIDFILSDTCFSSVSTIWYTI